MSIKNILQAAQVGISDSPDMAPLLLGLMLNLQTSKHTPGFLSFFSAKIKNRLTGSPDIHHVLAEGNASDFTVIQVSECQPLFLYLFI